MEDLGVPESAHPSIAVGERVDGFDVEMNDRTENRGRDVGVTAPVEQFVYHLFYSAMVWSFVDQLLSLEDADRMLSKTRLFHKTEHHDVLGFQKVIHGPGFELINRSVCRKGIASLDNFIEWSNDGPPIEHVHDLVRPHLVPFDRQ